MTRILAIYLESSVRVKEAWHELWEELHHQWDVGEASYASIPHLVRIHRKRGLDDWNTYALVAVIELARGKGMNPEVPTWLRDEYFGAIQELAKLGAAEVLRATNPEDIRAILSLLALAMGARTHARFLLEYSDEELVDLERQAMPSATSSMLWRGCKPQHQRNAVGLKGRASCIGNCVA